MNEAKPKNSAAPANDKALFPPALQWLDKLEELASVILMLVILVAVAGQVIARYVFQHPIFWADELARYSYVWLAFIAATFITGRRQHITINVLDNFLTERQLRWLAGLAQLIVIVLCVSLTYFAFEWLLKTARPKSSALRVAMIWLYGGVWVSFVLMCLHSCINLWLILSGRVPASSTEDQFAE